jgi:hypothetical protein
VATIRNEISSAKEQARVAIKTALPMVQEEQSDGAAFDGDPCRRCDACCRLIKEIGNDGG